MLSKTDHIWLIKEKWNSYGTLRQLRVNYYFLYVYLYRLLLLNEMLFFIVYPITAIPSLYYNQLV